MTVPFGFSVGDVIAGIGVLKTTINAFHRVHGASKEYQRLSSALSTLLESLNTVSNIPMDPLHDARQQTAIVSLVHRCKECINSFLERTSKFKILEEDEFPKEWAFKVSTAVKKIQWTVCEKEKVMKFTQDVHWQIEEIGLLVATLQVYRSDIESKKQAELRIAATENNETLRSTQLTVNQTQELLVEQQRTLEVVRAEQEQLKCKSSEHLTTAQNTTETLRSLQQMLMNELVPQHRNMFQFILDQQARMHEEKEERTLKCIKDLSEQIKLQSTIPPQVLLQQPVTFIDANGYIGLVHLDFINCYEAFQAVLKVRFKDCGLIKIERHEFIISDSQHNRILDVSRSWNTVMRPGQHRNMSMVFEGQELLHKFCPACFTKNNRSQNAETVCNGCGLVYQKVKRYSENPLKFPIRQINPLAKRKKEISFGAPSLRATNHMEDREDIRRFRRAYLIYRDVPQAGIFYFGDTTSQERSFALNSFVQCPHRTTKLTPHPSPATTFPLKQHPYPLDTQRFLKHSYISPSSSNSYETTQKPITGRTHRHLYCKEVHSEEADQLRSTARALDG